MKSQFTLWVVIAVIAALVTACAQAAQPTATARIIVVTATFPEPSDTPLPTSTPEPTTTPTQEIPANSPILEEHPDWVYSSGDGFGLWLPDSYVVGSDPATFVDMARSLREAGQDQLASMLEANASYVKLYAFDSIINNSDNYTTNCNVVAEWNSLINDMTIDEYTNFVLAQYKNIQGVTVLETNPWSTVNFGMGKQIVAEYDLAVLAGIPGTTVGVQYLMKNEDHVWAFSCATTWGEYEVRGPDFEAFALGFHELPE
jgi:hypothetical protein